MVAAPRDCVHRAGRILVRISVGFGLLALFAAACVLGALAHMNFPAVRRQATVLVTQSLSQLFRGQIHLGDVQRISPTGVEAAQIWVLDPAGQEVIRLRGVRAHANLARLAWQLIAQTGPRTIVIDHVRVEHAQCNVLPNAKTGTPTLVDAFTLRAAGSPSAGGAPVEVRLPSIEIGAGTGQGRFQDLPVLEAEVRRASGSVVVGPGLAEIDVQRFGVRVRGIGGAVAQGTAKLNVLVPGKVSGSFDGRLGDIGLVGQITAEGRKINAAITLPLAEGEALRTLWPDWPLKGALTARLEARGTLPILETRAELGLGETRVGVQGPVRLTGDVGAHLDLKAERLDLSSLVDGAPATDLASSGSITFLLRQGRAAATFNAATRPTVVEGHPVPALDVAGRIHPQGIDASLTLHEPGLPLKVELSLEPSGALKLSAKSERFRIGKLPRLRGVTSADADTEFELGARLAKGQLDASLVSSFRDFAWRDFRFGRGRMSTHLRGPIAQLDRAEIEAQLETSQVRAGQFSLPEVRVEARGPVLRPELRITTADAHGLGLTLTTTAGVRERRLDRTAFVLTRGDAKLEGKVKSVDYRPDELEVKEAVLSGAGGQLTGSLRLRPDVLELGLDGSELNLDVLARTLGLPAGLVGGRVRVQADIDVGEEVSRGRLRLSVADGSWDYQRGIDGELSADLSKEHLTGTSSLKVKDLGEVQGRFTVELGGNPLALVAWQRAVGQAAFDFSGIDLAAVRKFVPADVGAPVVTGSAAGWVNVERANPAALPNVVAKVATRGFSWRYGEEDGATLKGVEVVLGAAFDGNTGQSQGTVQASDFEGTLCAATLQTKVDLATLRENPGELAEKIAETPFRVVVDVPERSLALFPEPLKVTAIEGRVGLRVTLAGRPVDPVASLDFVAHGLKYRESRNQLPIELQGATQYHSASGRLTGNALIRSAERQVGLLSWQAEAPWQVLLLGGEPDQPSWRGEARLTLTEFPLTGVPPLADARIAGNVNGELSVQRQELVPTAQATLRLTDITVQGIRLGNGKLTLNSAGKAAEFGLDLSDGRGTLSTKLIASTLWQNGFWALDPQRNIEARLHAHGFDAAGLTPLTADVLTTLRGSVDAELNAVLRPEKDAEHPEEVSYAPQLTGHGSLTGGTLALAGFGLELRDVSCQLDAFGHGETTKIQLRDLKGSARSKQQNVSAWADLELLHGRVERGKAALQADRVPLPIEGVNLATARGKAEVELERTPSAMKVKVRVAELVAELPRSSTRSVISLQKNPRVTVAQPLGEPQELHVAEGLPWEIEFELGKVRIERGDVYLPVSGKPRLLLGKTTEVDGYVDLEPGGRLVALGKLFQVESGRVWFDSVEPTNPRISVTASWRGPEATIYIEVRGRWKNAELSLRSDPPRPQPELLTVLLQGSTGSNVDSTAGKGQALLGAQTAASVLGLGDVLAGTPLSGLEVRADTSSQGKEAYAASVRVSDRVWLEGIYRRQTAVGQTTTGSSTQNAFAGAVDLRLGRDWSLRTEGGNASAAVDLLWQYRY